MTVLSKFQRNLIRTFQSEDVHFVVVGGVASVYYGVQRGTGDLDILLEAGKENGVKVLTAFSNLKLDANHIYPEDFEKQLFLSFGFEPDAVDIMTFTPGIDFKDAIARANQINAGNLVIPILHLNDLIKNKEALNRPGEKAHLDAFDIQELKRIRSLRLRD